MARLQLLSSLHPDRSEMAYDPTGNAAFTEDGQRIGSIRDALLDETTMRVRYLVVDLGGLFSHKFVLVPVGLARIGEGEVHFDNLTRADLHEMRPFRPGEEISEDVQTADEHLLRRGSFAHTPAPTDTTVGQDTDRTTNDPLYTSPQTLRLLEERLVVDKTRYVAGTVEVGKHVETREERIDVPLQREEVVIERRPVTPRPADTEFGASEGRIRLDVEAERATIRKDAYVAEEVTLHERTVSEQRTITDTVGREVLDVRDVGSPDRTRADVTPTAVTGAVTGSADTRTTDIRTTGDRVVEQDPNLPHVRAIRTLPSRPAQQTKPAPKVDAKRVLTVAVPSVALVALLTALLRDGGRRAALGQAASRTAGGVAHGASAGAKRVTTGAKSALSGVRETVRARRAGPTPVFANAWQPTLPPPTTETVHKSVEVERTEVKTAPKTVEVEPAEIKKVEVRTEPAERHVSPAPQPVPTPQLNVKRTVPEEEAMTSAERRQIVEEVVREQKAASSDLKKELGRELGQQFLKAEAQTRGELATLIEKGIERAFAERTRAQDERLAAVLTNVEQQGTQLEELSSGLRHLHVTVRERRSGGGFPWGLVLIGGLGYLAWRNPAIRERVTSLVGQGREAAQNATQKVQQAAEGEQRPQGEAQQNPAPQNEQGQRPTMQAQNKDQSPSAGQTPGIGQTPSTGQTQGTLQVQGTPTSGQASTSGQAGRPSDLATSGPKPVSNVPTGTDVASTPASPASPPLNLGASATPQDRAAGQKPQGNPGGTPATGAVPTPGQTGQSGSDLASRLGAQVRDDLQRGQPNQPNQQGQQNQSGQQNQQNQKKGNNRR